MKLILSLFIVLISAKECDKQKAQFSTQSPSEMTSDVIDMRIQDPNTTVSYRASTRGYFLKIWIKGDSISFSNDYNLKEVSSFKMPNTEKVEFYTLLNQIDKSSLSELESPTKTHQYDAAPAASLEISEGDEVFRTNNFDHGKPPKSIASIIEKMQSIKAMLEKQ